MIEEIRNQIKDWAEEFGAKNDGEFTNSYIERKNIDKNILDDKGAFFGLYILKKGIQDPIMIIHL